MSKAIRRLSLIPMLALVIAASLSTPRKAEATACLVRHFGCPEGFYDCCCGTFQSCWLTIAQCQSRCGD
jgi:hypothetical protein